MTGVRTLLWLFAGIVAAVAVHFAIDVQTSVAPQGLRRNVLVPNADRASALTVCQRGKTATTLVCDGAWKIVRPYAATAEQSVVLRLTDTLAFLPTFDEMTDAELLRIGRTRNDFGLGDPRVVVTVETTAGKSVKVSFGADTPTGEGVYASIGDMAAVHVVSSNAFVAANLDVSDFRCRSICAFQHEDVSSFDVKNGNGGFVRIVRDGESWKTEPHAGSASSSRVRQFFDALVGLDAQSFVWPVGATNETGVASASLLAGYGLDAETAFTVTLKCVSGKDCTVSFGKQSGDEQVYALVQGGCAIVTVFRSAYESVRGCAEAFSDARLFQMDAAAVGALSLDDGGTAYLLSRNAEGVWRLDAPVSALADRKSVQGLVERVLSLKSSDMAAAGVRVSVGTNAEPVSVSRRSVFADSRPEDLRSKTIVHLDPKSVKRVVVTDKGGASLSAVFDADRKSWVLENSESTQKVDDEALAKMVGTLCPLEAVRVVRLNVSEGELGVYGLDKSARTIAVDQTSEGSIRRNVQIGDVTDGGRYATLGASDAVFVISSESAAALLAPISK